MQYATVSKSKFFRELNTVGTDMHGALMIWAAVLVGGKWLFEDYGLRRTSVFIHPTLIYNTVQDDSEIKKGILFLSGHENLGTRGERLESGPSKE